MTISRARSGGYRATMPSAASRSRLDLPDSMSPSTRKCGSAEKSRLTGDSVVSSMPNGTAAGARSAVGSPAAGNTSGSMRTSGARRPGQATSTVSTSFRTASGSPSTEGCPSIRGSAVWKCRPSRVSPRPGERSGTFIARARPISDSYGSPSRSSNLVPSRSLMPGRNSDHLFVAAITWMP